MEATWKPPRHSGSPRQCFSVLPDALRPPWSSAMCSQTLQEQSQVLLKAPAVSVVYSICSSAKNISVLAEWLRQSGRAPSEPLETPRWRITPCPASIPRVAFYIALRSRFRRFFLFYRSPIHSGVVANCDHMLEWVHWVHACIRIAMGNAAKISPHFLSTLSSSSVGRDPHNSVDPRNLGKSE
jgi:hypothetical protein